MLTRVGRIEGDVGRFAADVEKSLGSARPCTVIRCCNRFCLSSF